MKRSLFAGILAVLFFGASDAKAGPVFDAGYSSYTVVGFRCSTGTVSAAINASRPTGFTSIPAGYRIVNHDSADDAYFGGPSVSTATVLGDAITNLGEKVASGGSITFSLGKAYGTAAQPLVPVYCKAEDDAGAGGVVISVAWFGY